MELLLEGILAIQAGANPRVVEQRLLSYLSPKEQEAAKAAKQAGKQKAAARMARPRKAHRKTTRRDRAPNGGCSPTQT